MYVTSRNRENHATILVYAWAFALTCSESKRFHTFIHCRIRRRYLLNH